MARTFKLGLLAAGRPHSTLGTQCMHDSTCVDEPSRMWRRERAVERSIAFTTLSRKRSAPNRNDR